MSRDDLVQQAAQWLDADRNGRGASLNTLAGVVVILDRLIYRAPLTETEIITAGGQLAGGRGTHLRAILRKHGLSDDLLSDGVTTRSTQRFSAFLNAIMYGEALASLSDAERERTVKEMIRLVAERVTKLKTRDPLILDLRGRKSLSAQISDIIRASRERSRGRIEQHLVGAKLEERFGREKVNRERAYSADMQTARSGDFAIYQTIYHVTSSPLPPLINKIRANLAAKLTPVLLVPAEAMPKASQLLIAADLTDHVEVFSLEAFLTQNILEMADAHEMDHAAMLRRVLVIYNERIAETEKDQSLRIDLQSGDSLREDVPSDP